MFRIDPDTGGVFWNDYHLHIRLTHDEFAALYPDLSPVRQDYLPGLLEVQYQLSHHRIGGHDCILTLIYINRHISDIVIYCEIEDTIENNVDKWLKVKLDWIRTAQLCLMEQFGEPHESRSISPFNPNNILPKEYTEEVVSWSYKFEWGKVGISHDGLCWGDHLYISYDERLFIRTWDELATECEALILYEQAYEGKFKPSEFVPARNLIALLRESFEFQKVRPEIIDNGLYFKIPLRSRKAVTVRLNHESQMYKIVFWQADSRRNLFIAEGDHAKLIQELRLFLETENL